MPGVHLCEEVSTVAIGTGILPVCVTDPLARHVSTWLVIQVLSSYLAFPFAPDISHSFMFTSELIPIQIVFPLFCFASQICFVQKELENNITRT